MFSACKKRMDGKVIFGVQAQVNTFKMHELFEKDKTKIKIQKGCTVFNISAYLICVCPDTDENEYPVCLWC